MKRKFINGLLAVAVMMAAASSFVSCKDYEEERFTELQQELANRTNPNTSELATVFKDSLDNMRQRYADCQANCAAQRLILLNLINDRYTKGEVDTKLANYYTKPEVDQFFADYWQHVKDTLSKYYTKAEMDTKLNDYYTKAQADAKFYTKDDAVLLESRVATLESDAAVMKQNIIDLQTKVAAVEALANALHTKDSIRIDSLAKVVAAIKQCECDLSGIRDSLDKAYKWSQEARDSALKHYTYITTLQNDLKSFKDQYKLDTAQIWAELRNMQTKIDAKADTAQLREVLDSAVTLYNRAKEHTDTIVKKAIEKVYADMADSMNVMRDSIGNLRTALSDSAANLRSALNDSMVSVRSALVDSMASINKRIDEVEDSLNKRIDSLITAIEEIKADVAKNAKDIKYLKETLTQVMNKWINSIIIQGTENPIFGSFIAPLGINTKVLAAYYGTVVSDVVFPSFTKTDYEHFADGEDRYITAADVAGLGAMPDGIAFAAGQVLLKDDDANAGKVYLTINPTNRDFTGTTLTLANSRGQESKIELLNLRPSDHLIAFGYDRARSIEDVTTSANGFYEADARLKAADINNVKPNIDIQGLKDVMNDLKENKTKFSIANLAMTLYNNISSKELNLPAYAAKVAWEDSLGQRSVVSNYELAATAMKALSFHTLDGWKLDKIPGVDAVEKFISKTIDKIKMTNPEFVNEFKGITVVKIDKLKDDYGKNTYMAHTTVTIKGYVYPKGYVKTGNSAIDAANSIGFYEETVPVDVDVTDQINTIFSEFNGEVDEINQVIGRIQDMLNALNKFDVTKVLDKSKNDIKKQLTEAIDNLTDKIKAYMVPNNWLQPIIVVSTDKGSTFMSKYIDLATPISQDHFLCVPTSYSAELLAPAYKKWVLVTNAYKVVGKTFVADKAEAKRLNEANSELNRVIEGSNKSFDVTGLKKGYVYEVTYSAIDYSGHIAARKHYVKYE
jgi:uncharacterized coiled-coil protein SlyX